MMLRQLRRAAPLARAARAFSSVPDTMAAAVVHETGGADVLTVESAWPVPTLADGQVRPLLRPRQLGRSALGFWRQVLVKNEFAGINFIDTYHRGGLYPRDLPFIGAPTPLPAALLRSQRGRCSAPGLRA